MTDTTRPFGDGDDGRVATALADWLPDQRWFAGKGRPIRSVGVVSATTLIHGDPALIHLLIEVTHEAESGAEAAGVRPDAAARPAHESKEGVGGERAAGSVAAVTMPAVSAQLTAGHGETDEAAEPAGRQNYQLLVGLRADLPQRLGHAVIGSMYDKVAYDGLYDTDLTACLLEHFAAGDSAGALRFHRAEGAEVSTDLASLVVGAEQSNTSVVFGDEAILKLFRRVAPGLNPDLELTLALASAGSARVAAPLAWFDMQVDGQVTTLGMLQEYLRTATDGWELAKTSVRDLYFEGDLHPDEVGGDFAGESFRLGVATAEVHDDLARTLPTATLRDDALTTLAHAMTCRLDEAAGAVPELAPYARPLRGAYEDLARLDEPVAVQRIHGDYHLGQVMRTSTNWVLLDFEGEPARPLRERRTLHSPLRDVAAMLRSFDYAARHMLSDYPNEPQLEYRATEWAERNRNAFCAGYAKAAGRDPRQDAVLLRAFETDKAVYEVLYEARHRPSWLPIPMSAVRRLSG
jgi:maltokinase